MAVADCALHCPAGASPAEALHCPAGLNGAGTGPVYDLSFYSNCTGLIRGVYQNYLYPRIATAAKTRVLLVPGAQASAGHSPRCNPQGNPRCDNPLNSSVFAYDTYWAQQALDMYAWAAGDRKVAGFAPFHFCDEPSYGPRDQVGFRNMPQTLSVWTEIGLKVVREIPGVTTLRGRLAATAAAATTLSASLGLGR